MVHQRGLVCILPLIIPDSTRSFAGVSATTIVPMTFQLLKICSLMLTNDDLNALSIPSPRLTPILPAKSEQPYNLRERRLLSRRLPNWTNVTTYARILYKDRVISSFFIFHSFYIRCCVLADRTNGCAYATVLRLSSSVCLSVTLCIVAKRCVLEQKLPLRAYRKSYMRIRLVPKWMTLTFVYRSYQGHVNHCVTLDVEYLGNRWR